MNSVEESVLNEVQRTRPDDHGPRNLKNNLKYIIFVLSYRVLPKIATVRVQTVIHEGRSETTEASSMACICIQTLLAILSHAIPANSLVTEWGDCFVHFVQKLGTTTSITCTSRPTELHARSLSELSGISPPRLTFRNFYRSFPLFSPR